MEINAGYLAMAIVFTMTLLCIASAMFFAKKDTMAGWVGSFFSIIFTIPFLWSFIYMLVKVMSKAGASISGAS